MTRTVGIARVRTDGSTCLSGTDRRDLYAELQMPGNEKKNCFKKALAEAFISLASLHDDYDF